MVKIASNCVLNVLFVPNIGVANQAHVYEGEEPK
jgi:hypothetical protein